MTLWISQTTLSNISSSAMNLTNGLLKQCQVAEWTEVLSFSPQLSRVSISIRSSLRTFRPSRFSQLGTVHLNHRTLKRWKQWSWSFRARTWWFRIWKTGCRTSRIKSMGYSSNRTLSKETPKKTRETRVNKGSRMQSSILRSSLSSSELKRNWTTKS